MKVALDMPLEYDLTLKNGSWAMTRVTPSLEDQFIEVNNIHYEYDENIHFIK